MSNNPTGPHRHGKDRPRHRALRARLRSDTKPVSARRLPLTLAVALTAALVPAAGVAADQESLAGAEDCGVTVASGSSIQQAIDGADDHTVVCLEQATYDEQVTLDKPLHLTSVVPNAAEIAPSAGVAVTVASSQVTVSSLQITTSGADGVRLDTVDPDNVLLTGLTLNGSDSGFAINLNGLATGTASVQDNDIDGFRIGVYVGGSSPHEGRATIMDNVITGTDKAAVEFARGAEHQLTENTFVANPVAVGFDSTDDVESPELIEVIGANTYTDNGYAATALPAALGPAVMAGVAAGADRAVFVAAPLSIMDPVGVAPAEVSDGEMSGGELSPLPPEDRFVVGDYAFEPTVFYSIQDALDTAGPGELVLVAGGNYGPSSGAPAAARQQQNLRLQTSGVAVAAFADTPVFYGATDASLLQTSAPGNADRVAVRVEADNVTVTGVDVVHQPQDNVEIVSIASVSGTTLENVALSTDTSDPSSLGQPGVSSASGAAAGSSTFAELRSDRSLGLLLEHGATLELDTVTLTGDAGVWVRGAGFGPFDGNLEIEGLNSDTGGLEVLVAADEVTLSGDPVERLTAAEQIVCANEIAFAEFDSATSDAVRVDTCPSDDTGGNNDNGAGDGGPGDGGGTSGGDEVPSMPFGDVSAASVHHDAIARMAAAGIVEGRTADTFDPAAASSRNHAALMLARLLNVVELGGTGVAALDNDAAVGMLVERGILQGREGGDLALNETLTRGQLATMLWRAVDQTDAAEAHPVDVPRFSDTAATTHGDAVEALAAAGLVCGFNDGTFKPNEPVSRAQLTSMMDRTVTLLRDGSTPSC